jgi:hypothetical protein
MKGNVLGARMQEGDTATLAALFSCRSRVEETTARIIVFILVRTKISSSHSFMYMRSVLGKRERLQCVGRRWWAYCKWSWAALSFSMTVSGDKEADP